jgi:hypothetical protein
VSANINHKQYNGVIIWLSRGKDDLNKSVYQEIINFRNSEGLEYGPIYLVDNHQASFLYSMIMDLQGKYKKNYNFVYQTTGNNIQSIHRVCQGPILPIEMITSPLQIIRSSEQGDDSLNVYLNEPYSDDNFTRLIDLSRNITETWAKKIVINFSDFDHYKNDNSVNMVKQKFADKELINKISIGTFTLKSFRELEGQNG